MNNYSIEYQNALKTILEAITLKTKKKYPPVRAGIWFYDFFEQVKIIIKGNKNNAIIIYKTLQLLYVNPLIF